MRTKYKTKNKRNKQKRKKKIDYSVIQIEEVLPNPNNPIYWDD